MPSVSEHEFEHRTQGTAGNRMEIIRSAANPLVKRIRSLQRRKARYQERAFVVEGFRAVRDVLAAGVRPQVVVFREGDEDAGVIDLLRQAGLSWRLVEARLFDTLTDLPHPQGILAVVPMPERDESPAPSTVRDQAPLTLVLDGIRDPGNLGTLFRSAAGAGVDRIYLTPETVDPYHPRAVRAAMGAHFRIVFAQISETAISDVLLSANVVGRAEAEGDLDYDAVDWTDSAVIIIGGEAFGASSLVRELSPLKVRIPLASDVESLNAAVAGSLLVFEAARQRRLAIGRRS